MSNGKQSGRQKYIGVIGHNLSHTLSPLMHSSGCKELNLDFVYGVFDVTERMVPHLIMSLRKRNFRGANVTVPHKKTVMPFLDSISEEASSIGAVNTIVNNNGVLEGYNTDISGIVHSIQNIAAEIKGNDVAILGAGGASRAVLFALATSFSPRSIGISNRTQSKAESLCKEFHQKFPTVEFRALRPGQETVEFLQSSILIVNTTTIGMKPFENANPLPEGFVIKNTQIIFDIVYNPLKTTLLTVADQAGARTISGLDMLIGQGNAAFSLFTGSSFDTLSIKRILTSELNKEPYK